MYNETRIIRKEICTMMSFSRRYEERAERYVYDRGLLSCAFSQGRAVFAMM